MASPAAPIESKVKAASVVVYLVSLAGLAILNAISSDPSLISGMPDALEPFVVSLLPASAAAIAGWAAPHTPRSDV
ncbi:holin [Streptomyces sp. NPDC058391]|uniref:holin n=1 Tax=Streptomyces sp. NPDC058391 TaxID=3346476 RepID=UPI00365BAB1E